MKVLALCTHPVEAAATRYRIVQYADRLNQSGIQITVSSYFSSKAFLALYKKKSLLYTIWLFVVPLVKRFINLFFLWQFDAVIIQREAMPFGPPIVEWIAKYIYRLPLILDLDDATYIAYVSPTYGKLGSFFKAFWKTDYLIKQSKIVICGNRFIADYVEKKGVKTIVIPTVVDTNQFCPIEKNNDVLTIGWLGTHSTFPFLKKLFPVLKELKKTFNFKLKVIGSGTIDSDIADTLDIDYVNWELNKELSDLQSFDIGLYPVNIIENAPVEWLAGKSGFKAIQYMSVGIPFVMTPIGVCKEIGIHSVTHFNALTDIEWLQYLTVLLENKDLRDKMGKKARQFALDNYDVNIQADKIAKLLHSL